MKLTDWDLTHEQLEIRQRDGSVRKVERFAPHEKPRPNEFSEIRLDFPERLGGPRSVRSRADGHGAHAFVLKGQDGFEDKSFLVDCDGTIISASD